MQIALQQLTLEDAAGSTVTRIRFYFQAVGQVQGRKSAEPSKVPGLDGERAKGRGG